MRRVGKVVVFITGLLLSPGSHAAGSEPGTLELRAGRVERGAPMPAVPEVGASLPGSELFLVFLESQSTPSIRARVAQAGGTLLAYLPHGVHAVRLAPSDLEQVRSMQGIARVEPFHPWYRMDEQIREWVGSHQDPVEGEMEKTGRRHLRAVSFRWGLHAKNEVADAARKLGMTVAPLTPKGHVVEIEADPGQVLALAQHPEVAWIDMWTPSETDMDLSREASGAVWLETLDGSCGQGVRGEVFDAGLDGSHQDFDNVMLHGPHDRINHGTAVYGIVFGNGDRDGDGDAQATGMLACAEQGIFADKDEVTDRFSHTEELLSHPYYASFQSNSWGHTRTYDYTSYSHEMDDIIWRLDLPVTQSQSNSGTQYSRPEAWAKNVISVGGVQHANTVGMADDHWSANASIGPAEDGRIKPDVCHWADHIFTTTDGGYRPDFYGTSAATPQAAGVLGLILQMWSENVWNTNPTGATVFERRPHAATAKALLINTAEQYPFTGTDHDLARTHQGWGRPSARRARERASRSLVVDQASPLQLGESAHYEVEVQAGEAELKITMVYPDPPGTLSASMHRINDLDLLVRSPAGTLYYGNYELDLGRESATGGTPDNLNTVENIFLLDPESGKWQIEVFAREINQDAELGTGEQDASFALVVTGAAGVETCAGGEAPINLGASSPADNRVELTWEASAGAVEYRIYRSAEGCQGGFEALGTATALTFVDDPVSGGAERVYVVRAVNGCGGASVASNCASVFPTGACLDAPRFTGLEQARDLAQESCALELVWNAAEARCGGEVRYNVYRSQVDGFLPDPGNLVASCVTGSGWTDYGIEDSLLYHYVVRAEDLAGSGQGLCAGGFEDDNLVSRSDAPTGPDLVFYQDLFESNNGWTLEDEWEIGAPQGLGGSLLGGPDPAFAIEGSGALGMDLSGLGEFAGNYEREVSAYATSPVIDASGHGQVLMRYWRWLGVEDNPNDQAMIEIYDGSVWQEVWGNPAQAISHKSWGLEVLDLTSVLAGVSQARVRFGIVSSFNRHYCGWNVDQLELFEPRSCASGSSPPPPVPDGKHAAGVPMSAARAQGNSEQVEISWDVSSCPAPAYHLFHGISANLSAYAYSGAVCGLSPTGEEVVDVPDPPAGTFNWWLIAGAEGAIEGGHGYSSAGQVRSATGVGYCGLTEQQALGSCP